MKINPISVSSMFVDQRGMLNPVSGKLISGIQTALTGEWSNDNWQGNSGFSVVTSGDYFMSLQGSTIVCNWSLGDVILGGDTITLPFSCVKGFLNVASAAGLSLTPAFVNGDTVTLPDGDFEDLRICGTLIIEKA